MENNLNDIDAFVKMVAERQEAKNKNVDKGKIIEAGIDYCKSSGLDNISYIEFPKQKKVEKEIDDYKISYFSKEDLESEEVVFKKGLSEPDDDFHKITLSKKEVRNSIIAAVAIAIAIYGGVQLIKVQSKNVDRGLDTYQNFVDWAHENNLSITQDNYKNYLEYIYNDNTVVISDSEAKGSR